MRVLSILLFAALGLIEAGTAQADLAHGTPLFTCTAPTQGVDSFGNLYTLPASGNQALKEIHWYVDPPALVAGRIPTGTVPTKVTSGASMCAWQTTGGVIGSGSHTARATAADNSGAESDASNPLAFTVPAAQPVGPSAPTGLSVQ